MAEFLFLGSLALIFATLTILFVSVLLVMTKAIIKELEMYFLIYKMHSTTRKMTEVSARLQEATTVVLFDRVEEYRNGL